MKVILDIISSICKAIASLIAFKTSPAEQKKKDEVDSVKTRTDTAAAVKAHDIDAVNRATQDALKILVVMLGLTVGYGCRTVVPPAPVYIQPDEKVVPVEKGQALVMPYRGYLVPDSIYGALLDKILELKAKVKTLETK